MRPTIRHLVDRAGHDPASPPGRGFTLIELLIGVGALALVAVGVAAIFDATGKTIAAGRRVSNFNTYANLIEQQMRADFASMTRKGFLVVRNQYADPNLDGVVNPNNLTPSNPDAVQLFDADERPRLRRVDEIMFFASGRFTSARVPLDPSLVAQADAARIYYGHGQQAFRPASPAPSDRFLLPRLDEANNNNSEIRNSMLGFAPNPALGENPNRYASNWILMRHATLLAPPRTAFQQIDNVGQNSPGQFLGGGNLARVRDSDIQIAAQPAASSIFRALSARFPLASAGVQAVRLGNVAAHFESMHPTFDAGLVDIATCDLTEIRSVVSSVGRQPNQVNDDFFNPARNRGPDGVSSAANTPAGFNQGVDNRFRNYGAGNAGDPQVINTMQAWMDDAWPTLSSSGSTGTRQLPRRMRAEVAPTNFLGILDPATSGSFAVSDLERAIARADQAMLASSSFLPRCSEFIVEWSFGNTFPADPSATGYVAGRAGQLVWHGLERAASAQQPSPTNPPLAEPYDDSRVLHRFGQPYLRQVEPPAPPLPGCSSTQNILPLVATHTVQTQLIHGFAGGTTPAAGAPINSFFGYLDPTFDPEFDPRTGLNCRNEPNGVLDAENDARSPTIPWAWPKLIRVTLSLADPNDPSLERTYQFVFDVPAR
ncbi:MAG: type II secretion system protein [Phycisphaerae bacterium]|nr:type II secretion system protein [Phycisphaerae bacterium]